MVKRFAFVTSVFLGDKYTAGAVVLAHSIRAALKVRLL